MQRYEQNEGEFASTVIVWHKLIYGYALLPNSQRKNRLQFYLSKLLDSGLVIPAYQQNLNGQKDHKSKDFGSAEVLKPSGAKAAVNTLNGKNMPDSKIQAKSRARLMGYVPHPIH
ncbi:MAG: hypothetical protein ACU83U_07900 [Gammaproteobacteria bacterium]